MDDTSVVVAEVIEWTEAHSEAWMTVARSRRPKRGWRDFMSCGNTCSADEDSDSYDDGMMPPSYTRGYASSHSRERVEDRQATGCSVS